MSTDGTVRLEHRGYLIEITLSQNQDRTWNGDWAVFQRMPFCAVGAGMLGAPARRLSAAEAEPAANSTGARLANARCLRVMSVTFRRA